MNKQEWLDCKDLHQMLNTFTNERKKRLFSLACCRRIEHLLFDQRSKDCLGKFELFIDGKIGREELELARCAIGSVAYLSDSYWAITAVITASSYSVHAGALSTSMAVLNAQRTFFTANILRDIYNPYLLDLEFSELAISLALQVYSGDEGARGVLSDCLEEEGYSHEIVVHLKGGEHYKGCWLIDQILGKV